MSTITSRQMPAAAGRRVTIDVSDLRPGPLHVRSREAAGVARSAASAQALRQLAAVTAQRALENEQRRHAAAQARRAGTVTV
jgi:hypothetical protein